MSDLHSAYAGQGHKMVFRSYQLRLRPGESLVWLKSDRAVKSGCVVTTIVSMMTIVVTTLSSLFVEL